MTTEKRMYEELNRTLRAYKVISESGNRNLAEKVFEEFMAQQKLVQNVLGVSIDIVEDTEGNYKVTTY